MEIKKYDVVEVEINSGIISNILSTDKDERNAEAIISMAVFRRGVNTHFYTEIPAGSKVVGDVFSD